MKRNSTRSDGMICGRECAIWFVICFRILINSDWFEILWIERARINKQTRSAFHRSQANYFYVGRLFLLFHHASLEVQCQFLTAYAKLKISKKNCLFFDQKFINRRIRHVRRNEIAELGFSQASIFYGYLGVFNLILLRFRSSRHRHYHVTLPVDFEDWIDFFLYGKLRSYYALQRSCLITEWIMLNHVPRNFFAIISRWTRVI